MVYVVEDDDSIRELVVYTLNSTGIPAKGFALPSLFWAEIRSEIPDLVLLDIMLPEEDGLTVLDRLRRDPMYSLLPVILLTAKGTEYDKVVGFDRGADDYIPKPFGMMELVARVKALLRRSAKKSDDIVSGSLVISPQKHTVTVGNENIALTLKEFELLLLLARNANTVLTRDRLLENIWGYSFDGENRTVDVHIRTLRQKLGSAGEIIETVRGVGYKFSVK